MEVQNKISLANNMSKIGREMYAIIDSYDQNELCYLGRTYGDTPEVDEAAYIYSAQEISIGDIVKIKVLDAHDYDITGEVIF